MHQSDSCDFIRYSSEARNVLRSVLGKAIYGEVVCGRGLRNSLCGAVLNDWEVSKMQLKRLMGLVLSMLMMLAVLGCYGQPLSTREKGTLLGGVAGAGAGALIGSAVGHPGAGAAIGGVGGAAAGYGIGNHMQNEQNQRAYRNGYY